MRKKDWFDFSAADLPCFTLPKQGTRVYRTAIRICNVFQKGKGFVTDGEMETLKTQVSICKIGLIFLFLECTGEQTIFA